MDPKSREKLSESQSSSMAAVISPATQQNGQPSTQPSRGRFQVTMVQRPDGSIEFVAPNSAPADGVVGAIVAPRSVGLIYDNDGHIVVPQYIDRESIDDQHPLTVT